MTSRVDGAGIDPAGWYGPDTVKLAFEITWSDQEAARKSGALKFSQAGGSVVYRGDWLLEWLNNLPTKSASGQTKAHAPPTGAPKGSSLPQRQAAAASYESSQPHSGATNFSPPVPMKGGQADVTENRPYQQMFENEVERRVLLGMTRKKAVADVASKLPELHQKMLAEANSNRPHALKGIAGM
jgi:hypothetical protein